MKTGTPGKKEPKVREEKAVVTGIQQTDVVQSRTLTVLNPSRFAPAVLIGAQNNLQLPAAVIANLPEEFQGAALETLDTTFPPTVKWNEEGEWVAGQYLGYDEEVGPNTSILYHFDAKGKPFSIWGNTVLDRFFSSGVVAPGDMLLITYIGDIPTQPNPCRMFDIKKANPRKA